MAQHLFPAFSFLLLNFAPLLFGASLVRGFYPDARGSLRLALSSFFGLSYVVLVFLVLASLKLFSLHYVLLICALSSLPFFVSKKAEQDSFCPKQFFLERSPILRIALSVSAVLFLWEVARGLAVQPLAWDSMTYHLFFAARWVQEKGFTLFSFPGGMDGYSHFPFNGEIFAAWYMLPFHGDLAVNISNVPAWLFSFLALYAIARELKLSKDLALFASLLFCFSPMMFELLLTSYVDITLAAFLLAATLFFLIYERTAELKYAFVSALACGLAIGTKLSAIYYVLCLLVFCLLKSLVFLRARRVELRSLLLALLFSFVLAAIFGGAQYLVNFLETGNPLYPFAFFGFEESGYKKRVIEEIFVKLEQRQDKPNILLNFLDVFEVLGSQPLVWIGNRKFILFFIFLVPFFIQVLRDKTTKKFRDFSLFAFVGISLALVFISKSPDIVSARMAWPHLTARLLAVSLALSGVIFIRGFVENSSQKFVQVILSVLLLADVSCLFANYLHPFDLLLVVLGIVILLACFLLFLLRKINTPVFISSLIFFAALSLSHISYLRDNTRAEVYYSYHNNLFAPAEFRASWSWFDSIPGPKTIAFATGWWQYGHNWFLFPLLGAKLENKVVYASINRREQAPTSLDSGLLRETADKDIWLSNLRAQQVEYFLLQDPRTYEHTWIEQHADIFEQVFESKVSRIYKVHLDRIP